MKLNAETLGKAKEKVREFMHEHPSLCLDDKLTELGQKFNVEPVFLFLGYVALVGFVLFGLGGMRLLTLLLAVVRPIMTSWRAIESEGTEDDTLLVQYWVVFSAVQILDPFICWLPFYYIAKLALLLWAADPRTKGAQIIYDNFLRSYFVQAESKARKAMEQAEATIGGAARSAAGGAAAGSGDGPGLDIVVENASLGEGDDSEQQQRKVYVVAKLTSSPAKFKTPNNDGTGRHSWNAPISIPGASGSASVEFSLFHVEQFGDDEFLGSATQSLSGLELDRPQSFELALSEGTTPGTLKVSLTMK